MRRAGGGMHHAARRDLMLPTAFDRWSSNFARRRRLRIYDFAAEEQRRFTALYEKQIGDRLVQFSDAIAFSMRDGRVVISQAVEALRCDLVGVHLRRQLFVESFQIG